MPEPTASLRAPGGQTLSLRHVGARGRLTGLLLSMTLRQSYRNDTADTLETVYTFPLAWGAVLTGLAVEIAGRRLTGAVLARQEAEARYEEAVAAGDSPIRVRRSADSLHAVELGNLRPGEEAVIEVRYAQLLRVEQGRVRLSVPTTIAPRYGDPATDAGIRTHESVGASVAAAYPFDLEIAIHGGLAAGAIDSPTHPVDVLRGGTRTLVRLSRSGWLDRDVVIAIDAVAAVAPGAGAPGSAHAVRAPDGEGCVVLASFCPAFGARPQASLALKILVDCSGSMAGDSIAAARRAIARVLAELRPSDRFAYSRFGSTAVHTFEGLRRAEPAMLSIARAALAETEADLGGTELQVALASTFSLGGSAPADVLLVTDGDVWAIEPIVAAARASGQRVFAVGVGSAPAESLLRQLAESTGGACELVAPNEQIEAAIGRLIVRMRLARARDVRIDWGAVPAWSTQPPASLFEGDTLHVLAGFGPGAGAIAPRLSYGLDAAGPDGLPVGVTSHALTADAPEAAASDAPHPGESLVALLPRLAAWHRIDDATRRVGTRGAVQAWARELALRHQLVTPDTDLFLVHRRVGADKATDLPTLQTIEQMLAAGWGGTGTVGHGLDAALAPLAQARFRMPTSPASAASSVSASADIDRPAVWRSVRGSASAQIEALEGRHTDRLDIPAFLRSEAEPAPGRSESGSDGFAPAPGRSAPARGPQRSTPRRLLATVRSRLIAPSEFDTLVRMLERATPPEGVADALRALGPLGLSRSEAWLLIVGWLAARFGDQALPGPDAMRALDVLAAAVPAAARDAGMRIVAAHMGTVTLEAW